MRVFRQTQKVLFRHCDPAGIVFYPRLFEIVNDCVEAFFATRLDWPFEALHPDASVPTVATQTTFSAPSRHGDLLDLRLVTRPPGRTSLAYRLDACCAGETRFVTCATLVHVGADLTPRPWPRRVREILRSQAEAPE